MQSDSDVESEDRLPIPVDADNTDTSETAASAAAESTESTESNQIQLMFGHANLSEQIKDLEESLCFETSLSMSEEEETERKQSWTEVTAEVQKVDWLGVGSINESTER